MITLTPIINGAAAVELAVTVIRPVSLVWTRATYLVVWVVDSQPQPSADGAVVPVW